MLSEFRYPKVDRAAAKPQRDVVCKLCIVVILGYYWGYIRIMGQKMETTIMGCKNTSKEYIGVI